MWDSPWFWIHPKQWDITRHALMFDPPKGDGEGEWEWEYASAQGMALLPSSLLRHQKWPAFPILAFPLNELWFAGKNSHRSALGSTESLRLEKITKIIKPSCLGSCQVLVLVLPATSDMEAVMLGSPIAITAYMFSDVLCLLGAVLP